MKRSYKRIDWFRVTKCCGVIAVIGERARWWHRKRHLMGVYRCDCPVCGAKNVKLVGRLR